MKATKKGMSRGSGAVTPFLPGLLTSVCRITSVLDADAFVWDSAPMSQQEQESSLFPQVCFRRSVTYVVTFHPILFTLLWPSAILWDRTGVSKLVGKGWAQNILGSVGHAVSPLSQLLDSHYSRKAARNERAACQSNFFY